jgi:hypothetical protein
MTSDGFAWESLLHTDAPPGCTLRAALFTSYEQADERLLVEHLLPMLLKLNREADSEGAERQFFLLELDQRLKQLHDKIVVVSSTVHEEPSESEDDGGGGYAWIWRSIRQLTVGSRRRAVQHAKLWLLHWGPADGEGAEYLEIVVSSSNLTISAFKGQVQAAWRACVELGARRAEARLGTWGLLPAFLRELATSAGDPARLDPFVDLLARAECPDGVTFVASVPGTHSRQVLRRTPWGAAGLQAITPPGRGKVTASILSPYVGSWDVDTLRTWCGNFEGTSDRVELVWIDKHHPWARAKRWVLPRPTLAALTQAGGTLLHLRHVPEEPDEIDRFHEEHRPADDRWSHAKVYALRRGTSRRLLVTSANFSTSAWGCESRAGELTIENFELGVCLDSGSWPFENLMPFENTKDAATVAATPTRSGGAISWAEATWDGKEVAIECRCEAGRDLDGRIKTGNNWTDVSRWTVAADGRLRSATVAWAIAKEPPSVACLTCGDEMVTVPIFDARPAADREESLPPGVDEDAAQTMLDQLLFEQYGGRVAPEDDEPTDDENPDGGDDDPPERGPEGTDGSDDTTAPGTGDDENEDEDERVAGRRADSYAIPAFVRARQHLSVVDNWASRVKRALANGNALFEHRWLRRDGELLVAAFRRQAARDRASGSGGAVGADLAAEELTLRLKYVPEA